MDDFGQKSKHFFFQSQILKKMIFLSKGKNYFWLIFHTLWIYCLGDQTSLTDDSFEWQMIQYWLLVFLALGVGECTNFL